MELSVEERSPAEGAVESNGFGSDSVEKNKKK